MGYKESIDHIGDCSVISVLSLVTPFEGTDKAVVAILEKMMKTLPPGNFKHEEDNHKLMVSSRDSTKGNWYQISVTNRDHFTIGFDVAYGQDVIDDYIDSFFSQFFDEFQISLLNVDLFDERLRVLIPTPANHYRSLLDVLAPDGGLLRLVAGRNLYSFKPELVFSVDESNYTVCAIAFEGKSTRSEVDSGKYSETRSIEVQCGVARITNFIEYHSLSELIQKQRQLARSIILGPVTEHILLPLYSSTKAVHRNTNGV